MPNRRARDEGGPTDPFHTLRGLLRDKLSTRDCEDALRMLDDACAELLAGEGGQDETGGLGPRRELGPRENLGVRGASDSLAFDAAPSSPRGQAATRVAIARVAPHVGEAAVLACDSAESVFRTALVALGHPRARTIHRDALGETFSAAIRQAAGGHHGGVLPQGGVPYSTPAPTLARDGGDSAAFARRFPSLAALRTLG